MNLGNIGERPGLVIALGVWALFASEKSTAVQDASFAYAYEGRHRCDEPQSSPQPIMHFTGVRHRYQHIPTATGALHGLTGSAPLLALIAVTLLDDFQQASIYLLLFSIGTTLVMVVYAVLTVSAVHGLGIAKLSARWLSMGIVH